MKYTLIALSFLLLSGCATLKGKSKDDLLNKFGLPSQTMVRGNQEFYQYFECVASICTHHVFVIEDEKIVREFSH